MKIQILQDVSDKTYLKLDPRTKIFMLLIISTFMLSSNIGGNATYPRFIFALVPFILLLTSKRMKVAAIYVVLFILAWLSEIFLVYNTTGLVNIFIIMLSGLITRFFPGMIIGYYIATTTQVSEFNAAMTRLHIPQKIIIPLSVMFRFFPTVLEESRSINDAMRMRGVGLKSLGNNPAALIECRFVPLLISIVKIGDELSAAALTRGLGSPEKRTNVCEVGFNMWDYAFILIIFATIVVYITI